MNQCRACPAPIMWAKQNQTEKQKQQKKEPKANPLDARPNKELGNLRLDTSTMRYDVLTGDALREARERGEDLFVSHFVTCPKNQQFRKGGKK